MVTTSQIRALVKDAIQEVEAALAALTEEGCGSYRLRSFEIAGEIASPDGTVAAQTVTQTPLGDNVTVTEETKSLTSQESADTLSSTTANGGEKITGSRTTVE